MRDEEKQARREIERSTIFGEVLEQLDRDASGGELYDALVARGYWNEEERGAHSEGVRAGSPGASKRDCSRA